MLTKSHPPLMTPPQRNHQKLAKLLLYPPLLGESAKSDRERRDARARVPPALACLGRGHRWVATAAESICAAAAAGDAEGTSGESQVRAEEA